MQETLEVGDDGSSGALIRFIEPDKPRRLCNQRLEVSWYVYLNFQLLLVRKEKNQDVHPALV